MKMREPFHLTVGRPAGTPLRYVGNPLPRSFVDHPKIGSMVVAECDIVVDRSPLALKVLLFRTRKTMKRAWRVINGSDLSGADGVVNSLGYDIYSPSNDYARPVALEVDPRYFAIMGLCREALTIEVVAHEAVHAAIAYAERRLANPHVRPGDNPEEGICYPTGAMTRDITRWLVRRGEIDTDAFIGQSARSGLRRSFR